MPRRVRPAETTRREHWLRVAVNDRTGTLNAAILEAFGWSPDEQIEWLSPTREDDFAEYYDQAFLDRLGLARLERPLEEFWPVGGPRWDGLARTARGKFLLVEAKAHIDEMVDFRSKASPDSLARIHRSLEMVKEATGAAVDAPWPSPFFQYANRLAHLYFLAELNHVDAYLLFLSFADAPDVPVPATAEQWEGAHRLAWRSLGLGASSFRGRVAKRTISVPDALLAVAAGQLGGATASR
jgi:hypothetical protein